MSWQVFLFFFSDHLALSLEGVHKHCDKQNVNSDVIQILLKESKAVSGWQLESLPLFKNVTNSSPEFKSSCESMLFEYCSLFHQPCVNMFISFCFVRVCQSSSGDYSLHFKYILRSSSRYLSWMVGKASSDPVR